MPYPHIIQQQMRHTLPALLLIMTAGCTHTPPAATVQNTAPTWPDTYQAAIKDALNPEPEERASNLIRITPGNARLQWQTFNGIPHIKMVSVVSNTSYYAGSVGKTYNTGNRYTWVTVAPELQNTCSSAGFGDTDKPMRLRQLLGLTPDATITAVVEFWVLPALLFRPAADYAIDDTTTDFNMPEETPAWYRRWFNELRAKQYFQSESPKNNAYPWTQLGYTYDWGNPQSEQGLSEFVIRAQSEVIIHAIYSLNDYCQNTQPTTQTRNPDSRH